MVEMLSSWLIIALAVFLTAQVLTGVTVSGFASSLMAAVVLGLVNAVIRPIIVFFTLPINLVTLGLFSFVINALMVMLVGKIVPGFEVKDFGWALLFSIVLSVIQGILFWIL